MRYGYKEYFITQMTKQGKITIPARIRHVLGLKPGEYVRCMVQVLLEIDKEPAPRENEEEWP